MNGVSVTTGSRVPFIRPHVPDVRTLRGHQCLLNGLQNVSYMQVVITKLKARLLKKI
jgi:hypothetical protein